jgi:hypothetical protein
MKPKNKNLMSVLFLALGVPLLLLAVLTLPVQADEGTPVPDSGCIQCHEDLYYLYDTGKWFCQCDTQMSCTCCHGGNPEALTEEDAHLGMALYPTRNGAQVCQECHPDDYEARAEYFAEVAGVSAVHGYVSTPTILAPAPSEIEGPGTTSGIPARLLEPWRLAGLIVVALALVVLVFFGYRCWKADCLARRSR